MSVNVSDRAWIEAMNVLLAPIALAVSLAFGPPGIAVAAGPSAPAQSNAATPAREVGWDDLKPPGWDPMALMREKAGARGIGAIMDGDPRAFRLLREMREIWDSAPTNDAMDGVVVKLPGYVVPLEEASGGIREFLLVPYFGACIHTPPPPANQIIDVLLHSPARGVHSMDAVWVTGKLSAKRHESYMGNSGYQMQASRVEPYVEPKK